MQVEAIDDQGMSCGPATLMIGANEVRHFNSEDLEMGNAMKGRSGGTGMGTGNWQVVFTSTLPLDTFQTLTPKPRNAVAHSVRAITEGPHALLGRVGSSSTDRYAMRDKDGEQAFLQDVEAKVAISLSAFAEGGSAFIDRNLDGGLSTGEAFPSVEGGGERRLTLPLEAFLGRSLPIYYSPPIGPTGIQPDTVALCVAVNSTVGSVPKTADHGCAATGISYDAQAPQPAVGLRGGSSLTPSTLTLTCLDRWEACQILAECRNRSGTLHHAQLPAIAAGATEIYSASKLADALAPVGFLEATSANLGHCLFHSSRALSVVQGGN